MPRDFTTATFSHDNPELIERAKAKAKRLHMSFSGYVVSLIEKDLGLAPSNEEIHREIHGVMEMKRSGVRGAEQKLTKALKKTADKPAE